MPRGIENLENEIEKKVEEKIETKVEEKPVENITKTSAPEVHWTVPSNTNKVYLYELDQNGKQVTSYTISNYITMTPNHTFVIVAKS